MFLFQFFVQSGLFFVVPLFLSVSLGLSAIDTGVRLLPLSVTLLIAAIGIPRWRPDANPRRVVRLALVAMFAGTVVLLGAIDQEASAEIVTVPLLLVGLGIGALASQLGAVTVSAVPDELSPEVGGLQNTATNIGASLGTALVGSVLIASLTATLITGIQNNPDVPARVKQDADTKLASGVPFLSDKDLEAALNDAGVTGDSAKAIVDENSKARLTGLRYALSIVALVAVLALFFTGPIPTRQPGATEVTARPPPAEAVPDRARPDRPRIALLSLARPEGNERGELFQGRTVSKGDGPMKRLTQKRVFACALTCAMLASGGLVGTVAAGAGSSADDARPCPKKKDKPKCRTTTVTITTTVDMR